MPEPIVTLNDESLRSDLRELVGKTVEDTLNGLLEAEADDLVGAERYKRIADREAYRDGHYDRVPKSGRAAVAAILKAINAMESCSVAESKDLADAEELNGMRLGEAAVSAPTTPSSASTARSAGGPAWLAPSPTACRHSCSSPRGSSTSRRANGGPAATWT